MINTRWPITVVRLINHQDRATALKRVLSVACPDSYGDTVDATFTKEFGATSTYILKYATV